MGVVDNKIAIVTGRGAQPGRGGDCRYMHCDVRRVEDCVAQFFFAYRTSQD